MGAALPPKVFVSYSHDSEPHRERVLALADRLRAEGVDVSLDRYVSDPPEGWPRWMQRQLVECDLAVLVCTPTYRQRFDREDTGGAGKGAKWEAMIAEQILYEAQARNEKLVPVLFEEGREEDVPLVLRAYTRYQLMRDYDRLYRRLTGQPETPPPRVGPMRVMPPAPRPGLASATSTSTPTSTTTPARARITDDMLVDELAKAFAHEEDARLVVERAGFPPGQIPAFRRALVFWSTVVSDARNGVLAGGARPIAEAAAKLQPNNPVIAEYLAQ